MGVSWAILSSWGVSTADYVLYTLVSGIWNVFARLSLPVLALLVLVTATRPDAILIAAAAVGLALLAAPGGRARPAAAQRVLRASSGPDPAVHSRPRLSAGTPAGAIQDRHVTGRLP